MGPGKIDPENSLKAGSSSNPENPTYPVSPSIKTTNNPVFDLGSIAKKNFEDRWVKFAFGPQGYKKTKSLNLGIVNFSKNKISLNHRHDVEEALYILSGKGKIKISGRVYTIKKDDFIYIPADTDHQVITDAVPVKILFIFGGQIVITH